MIRNGYFFVNDLNLSIEDKEVIHTENVETIYPAHPFFTWNSR